MNFLVLFNVLKALQHHDSQRVRIECFQDEFLSFLGCQTIRLTYREINTNILCSNLITDNIGNNNLQIGVCNYHAHLVQIYVAKFNKWYSDFAENVFLTSKRFTENVSTSSVTTTQLNGKQIKTTKINTKTKTQKNINLNKKHKNAAVQAGQRKHGIVIRRRRKYKLRNCDQETRRWRLHHKQKHEDLGIHLQEEVLSGAVSRGKTGCTEGLYISFLHVSLYMPHNFVLTQTRTTKADTINILK